MVQAWGLRCVVALCLYLFWSPIGAAQNVNYDRLARAEQMLQSGQSRRAEAYLLYLTRETSQAGIYLDALTKAIKRHPWQVTGGFALRPSSNANRAATARVFETSSGDFEIENGGESQASVGLQLSAGVAYRWAVKRGRVVSVTGNLSRTAYEDADISHWDASLSADYRIYSADDDWRFGLQISSARFGDAGSDRDTIGARVVWTHRGEVDRTITLRAEHRDYLTKDNLDGPYVYGAAGWAQRVDDNGYSWGLSVERSLPDLGYQRYWGVGVRADYRTEITDNIQGGITASMTARRYNEDFSGVDYARRDDIAKIGLTLSDDRIEFLGATPTFGCTYTRHGSNISLYETDYVDCQIGFDYRF
ncbi:hypothetical protein BVC71_00020 [Marivivens niveibacter]|uniref:Surface lipoprotein assembly modifier C-terminal domain-containing protein n=1 Tax=Marivivens niveibacter TaxID=1930667 RepID=A0A251WZP2_9RHOB|nr:surface lipoprotein assembly modifier [Marivivens niveibacter]OUD09949.1 hypothetical protein BVC71_00020 [Marivivens niveibacter]